MGSSNVPGIDPAAAPSRPWAAHALVIVTLASTAAAFVFPRMADALQLDPAEARPWAIVTHAFVHAGWEHVLANMAALWLMGRSLNAVLGHAGFLALYLGGAIAGGTAFLLTSGHRLVGASSAVGAVMGAFLALRPRSLLIVPFGTRSARFPAGYFLVAYFICNMVLAQLPQPERRPVAYQTHIAGMVFGFFAALALRMLRLLPPSPYDLLSFFGNHRR